jgi:hypothetical protein
MGVLDPRPDPTPVNIVVSISAIRPYTRVYSNHVWIYEYDWLYRYILRREKVKKRQALTDYLCEYLTLKLAGKR